MLSQGVGDIVRYHLHYSQLVLQYMPFSCDLSGGGMIDPAIGVAVSFRTASGIYYLIYDLLFLYVIMICYRKNKTHLLHFNQIKIIMIFIKSDERLTRHIQPSFLSINSTIHPHCVFEDRKFCIAYDPQREVQPSPFFEAGDPKHKKTPLYLPCNFTPQFSKYIISNNTF